MTGSELQGPHQGQKVYTAGASLPEAQAAMILVHGRGATAPSILELAQVLEYPDMVYLAPQAFQNTWYPFSFLSPLGQNQPGLDSALRAIAELVERVIEEGISRERIVLAGFSQGACLVSEFAARNPGRYGGLLVFSGGLIGPPDMEFHHEGSMDGTPVFLGCSDIDFHIPEKRVGESAEVFAQLGADVTKRIYKGMGHTIIQEEIEEARRIIEQMMASEV